MKKSLHAFFAVMVILLLLVSACGTPITPAPVKPTVTQAPTETPPQTEVPTATEPPAPTLGTADNPLIMALEPSATTQELQAGGETIAAKLSEATGYTIKIIVPTDYAATVEAMGAGTVHIGWLPPLAYMLAKDEGYADVALIILHGNSDHYAFQYVANIHRRNDDGTLMFTSYVDPVTGESTTDAATALKQFNGKKPCYTDPFSASGFVLPFGLLAKEGVTTKAGAWVQGDATVIKSVYLSPKGEICDFGATSIDARTDVMKEFTDVKKRVQVIYISDPIVPNDNVSFASNVPADVRAKVSRALLDLVGTEEGRTLLKNGGYDIDGLKPIDDSFYDDFRVYLEAASYDITSYK